MNKSEKIESLAAALAKAQLQFETAEKDHRARVETKNGGSYEFSYADFASYLGACRKALCENGLSFVQEPTCGDRTASVTTMLMHESGQWIEFSPLTLPLIPDSRNEITAQIVGSGVTYAKRYSLSSMLGLASEADDDGNTASGNTADISKRAPLPPCPKCGKTNSTIKGKPEYGGGLVCFKDGCKHKWSTPEYPACDKSGNPIPQEPELPPKAEGKKPAEKPAKCREYLSLADYIRSLGVTLPSDATTLINHAVNGAGDILQLVGMAGECMQIEKVLRDMNLTGDQVADILKKGKV